MARPIHAKDVGLSLAKLVSHYGLGEKDNFALLQTKGRHLCDFTEQEIADMGTYNKKDVEKMAAAGKQILFVSTKPQARDIVKQAAIDCGMPYLTDRWLGGLLTNFPEMKKLITYVGNPGR